MATWQVLDNALGGLLLVALILRHARRGWPDPLAGAPVPEREPTLIDAIVVLLAYFTLQLVASGLVTSWYRDADIGAGSHVWHMVRAAADATSLLISAYAAFILYRTRAPGRPAQCTPGRALLVAVAATLIALPLVSLQLKAGQIVGTWVAGPEALPEHPVLDAIRVSAWGHLGMVQLFVGAILIAPLVEELLFRGVFLSAMRAPTRGHWLGILGSALIFALLHIRQPQAVVPLFTLGLILGVVRVWTGRLWPCIVAHMLFNARTMVYTVLTGETK